MTTDTCRHCGEAISLDTSWPAGRKLWKDRTPHVGAFCAAVSGNPHEPIGGWTTEDREFLASVGASGGGES